MSESRSFDAAAEAARRDLNLANARTHLSRVRPSETAGHLNIVLIEAERMREHLAQALARLAMIEALPPSLPKPTGHVTDNAVICDYCNQPIAPGVLAPLVHVPVVTVEVQTWCPACTEREARLC